MYKRLDEMCIINMGQSPRSESYNDQSIGLPFFQGNADFGEIYPNIRIWTNTPTKIVDKGCLLISVRAPIGALNFSTEKCCIGRGLAGITAKENVCLKYIYYCLKYNNKDLNSRGTGSTFKAISKNSLAETKIKYVVYEKQINCANNLDKLYLIIRNREKQLKLLDNLIKSRFVEMFGDPITNNKQLKTEKLSKILKLKAGEFTNSNVISNVQNDYTPYPCYGGNGIRGYVSDYNQEGIFSLIGRQGALSGNVQFVEGKFKNTEHALLVTPLIKMNSIWLNQLLLNMKLERYQTGAAQPGISVKNLTNIPIILAELQLQNEFADFVRQVDKSKFAIQQSLDEMQILYDSLMQEYFG